MRGRLALKSSFIGIMAKCVSVVISFISNRFFIQYIGIELLGVNAALSNILGFLQLAELGIGTAITYALYQPIVDGNTKEVHLLMNLYQKIYSVISIVIIVAGIIMVPLVPLLITDSTYSNSYLYLIYFIQLFSAASTYLLAYKRNLLYADQKQYICTFTDACFTLGSGIIRIFIIIYFRSYIATLLLALLTNIASNLLIHIYCNKTYPFLREEEKGTYDKMNELRANVKDLFLGRIGGWIYSSTDQILITKFVGVISSGLMANYYTLKTLLNTISGAITDPIQPMIGNYIRECRDKKKLYGMFLNYTFIRFCIANVLSVGFIIMGNQVIELWLGEQFILPQYIVMLLAVDLFISITHGPTVEFVQVLGLFKNDRNMSFIGMIINLVSSIILVQSLGISGVLIGTVLAQCYYWIARASIVFGQFFHNGAKKYMQKIIKYLVIVFAEIIFINKIFSVSFFMQGGFGMAVLKCFICVAVCVCAIFVTNFYAEEWKYTVHLLKDFLSKFSQKVKSS